MVKTLPSNARGMGLLSGWRAKILYASQQKPTNQTKQNIKQKQYYNKFNKDKVLRLKKFFLKKEAEKTSDEAGRGHGNETRSRGVE